MPNGLNPKKLVSIPLTLASIVLGLIGAIIGTFPSFYRRTVARLGKLEGIGRVWSTLVAERQLTDQQSVKKLLEELDIPSGQVATLKFETGLNVGQVKTITAWVSQWDTEGKMLPNIIDVAVVSSMLREADDRQRNRWAFGFVALAFLLQALVLFS